MKKLLSIAFAGWLAVAAADALAQDARKDAAKKDSAAAPMAAPADNKPISKALADKEAASKGCMIEADKLAMGKDGQPDPKANRDALVKDCMDKKKSPMKKDEPKK